MSLKTETLRWVATRRGSRVIHTMYARIDYAAGGMSEITLEFSVEKHNGEYYVWHREGIGRTSTLKQAKQLAEATYLLGE
jgi:hypothetical protein